MVTVKPKRASRTRSGTQHTHGPEPERTTMTQARELLCTLVDYENAARLRGLDLTTSRFRKLTASERELLRAELIAEYIRLSVSSTGKASERHEEIMAGFCEKICSLGLPSHELLGTYLAAIDVVVGDKRFAGLDWLVDAVRSTMPAAMKNCAELIKDRSQELGLARSI